MGKKTIGSAALFGVVILAVLAFAGCVSKVNEANFEKIMTDMTQEEVRAILGPPTESSSVNVGTFSGASSIWKSNGATITIQFMNGKVMAKQFIKAGTEKKSSGER